MPIRPTAKYHIFLSLLLIFTHYFLQNTANCEILGYLACTICLRSIYIFSLMFKTVRAIPNTTCLSWSSSWWISKYVLDHCPVEKPVSIQLQFLDWLCCQNLLIFTGIHSSIYLCSVSCATGFHTTPSTIDPPPCLTISKVFFLQFLLPFVLQTYFITAHVSKMRQTYLDVFLSVLWWGCR